MGTFIVTVLILAVIGFLYFERYRWNKVIALQNKVMTASSCYYTKHNDQFEGFAELAELNDTDRIVYSFKPITAKQWLSADSYERLKTYL